MGENENISPILRYVSVPIYTNEDCQKTKYGPQAITSYMMCAGYDSGKLDACQVMIDNSFEMFTSIISG